MARMGTRTLSWLGTALVGAAAAYWFWPEEDTAPVPGAETRAEATTGAAVATAVPDQAPEPASSRVAQDGGWWTSNLSQRDEEPLALPNGATGGAAVRGRLTVRQRPWLHPAGVEVRLTRSWLDTVLPIEAGASDQPAPSRAEVRATTDAEGWFTLRFRPTSGELFFLIDSGGSWMDFQRVPQVPRTGDVAELGDVWLDDRGGIQGTVVDQFGKPIVGAIVRAVDDPLLDAGAGLDDLRAARNRGLDLFTVPGSTPSGPLPDWVVRRDQFLPFPKATTDKLGRFQFDGLRPGAHDLFVTAEYGHASAEDVQVAIGRRTQVGAVTLRGAWPVQVTFVDDRNEPWVGAEIAFLHRELGFGTAVQRTDARGQIEAIVPQPEACAIVFAYPGGGPWLRVQYTGREQHIRVPRPKPFAITLQDQRGAAIRGGRVRCYMLGAAFRPVDRALPSHLQPTEVGPGQHRGQFPCPMVMVGAASGYAPAIARVGEAEDLTLTMLPIHSITVRTIDRHGTPVAKAAVRIQAHGNPEFEFPGAQWDALANDRVLVGHTDDEGLLQVPVWDTFLSLQADHPEYGPSPGPKVRPQPGERIDLMLRRPARVYGRLSFHQRAASPGFRVRARQKPPLGHELENSGWLDEQLAVTGAGGDFAFRGLNAGVWELQPELPSLPNVAGAREPGSRWKKIQVLVAEDQELHCNLEAEEDVLAARQVVGTVTMDGVPVAGALVRLRPADGSTTPANTTSKPSRGRPRRGPSRSNPYEPAPAEPTVWTQQITTSSLGDFAFGDLQTNDDYELRIDVPWQDRLQFLERRVVHTANRATDAPTTVTVEVTTGLLQLTLTKEGQPFADRMLRLRQVGKDGAELARFECLTTPFGLCTGERLPIGTWTVEPVHGGYCRPAEFTIRSGENATALIEVLGR